MATVVRGQRQGRSGKEVDYYPQNGSLIYFISEVLLYGLHLLVSIHTGHEYLHLCPLE